MNDERIAAALKSLPRASAGTGFTSGVLRRLDEQPARVRLLPRWSLARWSLAAAAAVLILVTAFGVREWRTQQERQQALARLDSLLVEKQLLEKELRTLRRLVIDARPVVYLGGNEKVDLVLDVARFHSRGGLRSGTANLEGLRPADLRPRERATPRRTIY